MSFGDIVGQKTAVQILQKELSTGRISHAYLFGGKEGTGKKELAFQFAKALNCLEKNIDSCDSCLSCRKIDHFNHPDVHLIKIEEGFLIKIEQIRELQKKLSYRPYESKWQIYIVDQAEKMTQEAANSLLKTLEEPPKYAVIILLVEEISLLLPTVVSRCQQLYLNSLPIAEIRDKIIKLGLKEEKADLIAHLADGSLGKAIKLAKDDLSLNIRFEILDFLNELPSAGTVKIFTEVDKMVNLLNNKVDFAFSLFDLILSWFRDIIIYNQGNLNQLVNYDYLEKIKKQSDIYNIDELISIVKLVNYTENLLKQNVRKDLALQVMLFKIRSKRE